MGYFLSALPQSPDTPTYAVVDTRGPWFLGADRARIAASALRLLGAGGRVARAGLFQRPTLLHVNLTGRGSTVRKLMLTTLARAVGLPYLLHVHDGAYAADFRARAAASRRLVRTMFLGAEQIVVLGREAERSLRAALALPPSAPVMILPNAAPDPGPPRERAAGAPVRLAFLGHLSARKGVPELLEALATPALAALPWRATLAGGGPVEDFRARAEALGIGDRVTFTGWIDQAAAAALYAEADVLVLPSHAEGLALSVLEGLAHGLAIVATPVGAHAETIEAEASGLLVPPGDVAALTAALVRVIGDSALRERLGAGARRRFLEGFEARVYAARLLRLHAACFARPVAAGMETKPQSRQPPAGWTGEGQRGGRERGR